MTNASENGSSPESGPTGWVLGGSGLLGSAVRRALERTGSPVMTTGVPWRQPDAAIDALLEGSSHLPKTPWWLAWCAGSGVIASSQEDLDAEVWVLSEFLRRWEPDPGVGNSRAVFFSSSAGGLYAGSADPPFTEETEPRPISPYGIAKLAAEAAFVDFSRRTGVPVLIGRISNLYGPGQDLHKRQGLVSQLCKAHVTGRPLSLYVPLDTMRDYVYADDAGAMIVGGLRHVAEAGAGVHVKLFVSGCSVTINQVVGEVRRVTRRRPPVVTQPSEIARFQARDLRMRSVAWPDLAGYELTTFGAGIGACLEDVLATFRSPALRGG